MDTWELLRVQHEYSKFVTVREMCNLGTDDDVDYCMNIINCVSDIDFEEAEKLVKLGDRAVFDSDFEKFGEDCVMGKALDDRAGCALLMELLKEEAEYDITVCFTTREEVGGNGAGNAAFTVDPDIAVVVDRVLQSCHLIRYAPKSRSVNALVANDGYFCAVCLARREGDS